MGARRERYAHSPPRRGAYGFDAPYAPLLMALGGASLFALSAWNLFSGEMKSTRQAISVFAPGVAALWLFLNAGFFVYSTRVGKFDVWAELIDWLRGTRLTPIMVVHANHANELDDQVAGALAQLVDAGIMVLNQSVLLAGVNDTADALVELCERLVDLRVTPYYLHQLDRVVGAAHFEVPVERGLELMAELRRRLPGYAVPRYVQEIEGEQHKTVLA